MAHGEPAGQHPGGLDRSSDSDGEVSLGAVTTNSGRISAARRVLPEQRTLPFSTSQLTSLDEALTVVTRTTGLHFSVYLGDLGEHSRSNAEGLHTAIGRRAPKAVLIAVSPGQRVVEVVTGAESGVSDQDCERAVTSMVAAFKEGDLAGGLTAGLRMLADQAEPHRCP
ncbi:MAG: DUF5130 family protein [Pseudonocardiaceae bacterium]|nr:DUF5130 family protein [Pseudonocardiaceae bacterium]